LPTFVFSSFMCNIDIYEKHSWYLKRQIMKIQFSFIHIPINHSWVDLLFQFFLAVLSPPLKKDLLNPRGFTHIQQINSQGQCNHHTSNYITNYSWFCRLSSIHSFVFVSLSPKLFEQEYFFFFTNEQQYFEFDYFLRFFSWIINI
jgi:hypothetical protein